MEQGDKNMNGNDDRRIDIENLENVTGGTIPMYPIKHERGSGFRQKKVLNSMTGNLNLNNADEVVKPFDVCPKCGSAAVGFNREENICMCQDCGYCEDRSK